MTDETPEQQLRTAVMAAWPNIAKWDAALDLYGRERYLAGERDRLAAIKKTLSKYGETQTRAWSEIAVGLAEAEAEYAACVAALQEAKHG